MGSIHKQLRSQRQTGHFVSAQSANLVYGPTTFVSETERLFARSAEVARGVLSASFAKIENTELLVGGWRERKRKREKERERKGPRFLAEWVVGAKKW